MRQVTASDDHPRSTAQLFGHPLHPLIVPFPISLFTAALITDIVYWRTADVLWSTFSIWLLTGGLIMAGFAGVVGSIDFFGNARIRALRPAWPHALGNVVALLLSLVNAFVHSRDGYTAVVPTGLILSALVVVILMFSAWTGGSLVYRHGVGVAR